MVSKSKPDDDNKNLNRITEAELNRPLTKNAREVTKLQVSILLKETKNLGDVLTVLIGVLDGLVPTVAEEISKHSKGYASQRVANQYKATSASILSMLFGLYMEDVEDMMTTIRLALDKSGFNMVAVPMSPGSLSSSPSKDPDANPLDALEKLLNKQSTASLTNVLNMLKALKSGNKHNPSNQPDDLFDD